MNTPTRTRLSSNVTFAIPGNFDTMQNAWDTIQKDYDLNGYHVFIKVREGNHEPFVASGTLTGAGRADAITFTGNIDHPEKTVIRGLDSDAIVIKNGAWVKIEGFMVGAVNSPDFMGAGHGVVIYNGARAILGVMAYDNCDWSHIQVADSAVTATGAQYLLGRSRIFALAEDGAQFHLNGMQIINRVPLEFTHALFHASRGAMIDLSGTIISETGGPISGKAYDIRSNAVIILLYIDLHDLGRGTVESGGIAVDPRTTIQELKWKAKGVLFRLLIKPFVDSHDLNQSEGATVAATVTHRSAIQKLQWKAKDVFFELVIKRVAPWHKVVARHRIRRLRKDGDRESGLPKGGV